MRRWLLGAALAAVGLMLVAALAVVLAPEPLLRLALGRAGLGELTFEDVRIRADRLEIEGLTLGAPPAQELRRLRLGYRLGDLLAGRLQTVEIEGLRLRGRLDEDGFQLAGLEGRAGAGPGGWPALPGIERLLLRDAQLELATPAGTLRVPLEAEVRPEAGAASVQLTAEDVRLEDGSTGRLAASLHLSGRVPLDGAAALDQVTASGRLELEAEGIALPEVAQAIDAAGEVELALADGRLRAELSGLEVRVAGLAPRFDAAREVLPPPWRIVAGAPDAPFTVSLADADRGFLAEAAGPVLLEATDAEVKATLSAGLALSEALALQRVDSAVLDVAAERLRWRALEVPRATLKFTAEGPPDALQGRVNVEIAAAGAPAPGLEVDAAQLDQELRWSLGPERFTLALAEPGTLRAAALRVADVGRAGPLAARLEPAEAPLFEAELAHGELLSWRHALHAAVAPLEVTLAGDPEPLRLADAKGELALVAQGGAEGLRTGRLALTDAGAVLPEAELRITGLSTEVAFDSRGIQEEQRSPVRVASIAHLADPPWFRPLALEGEVALDDPDVRFEGSLRGPDGALALDLVAAHDLARGTGEGALELAPLTFAPDGLQPGTIAPMLGPYLDQVAGRLELSGDLSWGPGALRTDLALLLEDIGFTAGPARIEGLDGLIRFDRLVPPATPPDQQVAVALVDIGLPFTRGFMSFQVHPEPRLEVDRLRFRWAGGILRAEPFSIGSDQDAIPITLKAEGLQLGQIFEQVQLDGLGGEGTIHGTLPITLTGGEAVIDGGSLAAAGPGWLRYRPAEPPAGLAAGGENVQLLLDALENFRYEALRITLDGRTDAAMDVGLHLKGANPDLYDGYPIEFNLDLEGELANILRTGLESYRIPDTIRQRMEEEQR